MQDPLENAGRTVTLIHASPSSPPDFLPRIAHVGVPRWASGSVDATEARQSKNRVRLATKLR